MKASILNFTVHAVVLSFTAMVVSLLFSIICLRGQTIRKFWLIEDVTAVQEKKCSYNYTYEPEYKVNGFMITKPLLNYVENLLRLGMTLKSIALMTGLNKNTVKRIDKKRLKVLYTETDENGNTVLKNPETNSRFLAVDEFKLHDGYKFATVIIDLETGYILHLSHGKKKKSVSMNSLIV